MKNNCRESTLSVSELRLTLYITILLMPKDYEQQNIPGMESEALNPVLIAQIASRLFNELPEANSVPRYETDATEAPSSFSTSLNDKSAFIREADGWDTTNPVEHHALPQNPNLPYFSDEVPAHSEHDFYFLQGTHEKKPEPLSHHADKLTEQQNYSENSDGSHGLDEFIRHSMPPKPDTVESFAENNPESFAPFFTILNSGLPAEDDFSFRLLYSAAQRQAVAPPNNPDLLSHTSTPKAFSAYQVQNQFPEAPSSTSGLLDGQCYAAQLYKTFEQDQGSASLDSVFQSLRGGIASPSGTPELPGKAPAPAWPYGSPETLGRSSLPFSMLEVPKEPYYFLREPKAPIHQPEEFDVLTIRKDFPVLHQKIHGKQLVWFDNAATTQKPLSVINAVAQFYANDNSNIHRGAHTLAARATDAYEGAREKIRQFIGAGSASEIIYVRGTTEGINLVAQTWGRKFIQPGDEIVLSILEHHANIVPWQMLAQEKGARIKVVPVNDRGEIIMEEYTKLLGARTKFVSLTQASNGLGTILPIKEMIELAKRFDAKVLVDGAQSVAHIPVNVQDLDADFFVFSGHKIFAPTGIGVVYGKRELLEIMPPWQGGGNMIMDVRFEETIYNEPPAKFEAGTPSIGDAIGLGAALDYVRRIGLDNISRYEHELTEYATEKLIRIAGLRIIGTARNKVGVVSFVLNNLPNDEVGKLLDREGIAVRTGHHCSQPSLRRFGVEGTIRPSLAFYNTKDEIDRLTEVINHIQRR